MSVGIDLAGAPTRSTGFCRIDRRWTAETWVDHSDADIVRRCGEVAPAIIVVDAPLSLPRGRRTIGDRRGPHFRECDRELLRRRIPFFPITLGPMRLLTRRGIRIKAALESRGLWTVEGYPGGAQDLWGIPRKGRGVERLRRGLRRFGVEGAVRHVSITHDELDAVTLALVGLQILDGRAEALGDPAEGLLYLPRRE
ncbi:MAG TPA: DUF429 domain-containing protein [Thermoplasmata archaeon]|nr:DUF429 domain-containing protein [Thermoplasmata archaeon]